MSKKRVNYFVEPIHKAFDFKGRSTRKQFWMFLGLSCIVSTLLLFIGVKMMTFSPGFNYNILNNIYAFLIIIPTISISCRRIKDMGLSPFWIFGLFIPFVGPLVVLIMFLMPTKLDATVKDGPGDEAEQEGGTDLVVVPEK